MRLQAGDTALEVDDRGLPSGEPLLMIMGLGMQLIGWPEELVDDLVARGFRVIRLDNRDAGLSQGFDHLGTPNLPYAALRFALRMQVHAPYSLADMASDALGVLDALGIERAHVCGASMGGMIAQHLAAEHPERLRSLTLVMSTSGARRLPQARARVQRAMLSRPDGRDPLAVEAYLIRLLRLIGSPGYPPDAERLRSRIHQMVSRAWRPAGTARQLAAVAADGDRTPMLARISAPTHVIHGLDDPLVPVAAGHDLAALISGATLDIVPGMGHDLPLPLLARIADGIEGNAARWDGRGAA